MSQDDKTDVSHVADVLQNILRNGKSPLSEQFIRWRLWQSWQAVVGDEIAVSTMPVGYQDGILYVWVKNSACMQDLIFLVKPIKDKINHFANSCGWSANTRPWARQVRFTLDKKTVPVLEEAPENIKTFIAMRSGEDTSK